MYSASEQYSNNQHQNILLYFHFNGFVFVWADLPATRMAPGVSGEELPCWSESACGQFVWPVGNTRGWEKRGSNTTRRDASCQRGGVGFTRLQPQQTVFAREF